MDAREVIARAMCRQAGYDPDSLEPGDDPYCNNQSVVDATVRGEPHHYRWRGFVVKADAALSALEASGMAIVPVEATEAMHTAARDWSIKKYGQAIGFNASEGCWATMIAAAKDQTDGR